MDLNSEESLDGDEDNSIMNFITCRTIREKELYFCNICNNFLETLTLAKQHVREGHVQKKSEASSSSSPSSAVQPKSHEEQTRIEIETEYFECDDCHEFFETQLQVHRHRLRVHLPARRRVVKKNNVGKGSSGGGGQYSRKLEKIISCGLPPPTNKLVKRPLFLKTVEVKSILKGPRKIQDGSSSPHLFSNKTKIVPPKGSLKVAKNIGSTYKSTPPTSNRKKKNDDDDDNNNSKNNTEATFMCAICQKRYILKSNLKRHLLITHRPRRRQGDEIEKKSADTQERSRHHQQQEEEQVGQCKNVQKIDKIRPKLVFNQNDHKGRKTNKKSELQTIRRVIPATSVTRLGPKSYKCNFCKKRFTSLSSSLKHVLTHTGHQPFQCGFCSKKFSQKANMQRHERIHTCNNYQCPICRKQFRDQTYCTRHIERQHGIGTS